MAGTGVLDASSAQIYQYLNFDKIEEYKAVAATVAA
jgi:aconitate hydratase 2/2-methylisocitrate dehydratase